MAAQEPPPATPAGWPDSLPPPRITQIAIVVADLEATMAAYHQLLGWGPWNVYEYTPETLRELILRGEPVASSYLGAETQVGPVGFELLQPLEGPSLYREWLEEHGEGFHHLGCMMSTKAEASEVIERFAAGGVATIGSGRVGEDLEFFYLDTQPALKLIVETGGGHSHGAIVPTRTYPES